MTCKECKYHSYVNGIHFCDSKNHKRRTVRIDDKEALKDIDCKWSESEEQVMNKRPIDKTKKSNIKCEHCKFWCEWSYYGKNKNFYCKNLKSEHCDKQRNYWNRCKQFEWAESEE